MNFTDSLPAAWLCLFFRASQMRFAPLLMLALLATSCVAFGSGKNDEFSKAKCVIPVRKVLGNFIDTVKVNKEAKDTSVPDFLHVPNKCLRTFFDEVVKQNLGAENLLALHGTCGPPLLFPSSLPRALPSSMCDNDYFPLSSFH